MSEETKDSKNKEAVKKTTKAAEPKAAKKTTKPKVEKKASKEVTEPKVEKEIIESDITVSNEQIEEIQNTESTKEDSSKEDFLNDFDWNLFEEGIETIKDEKLSEFEKLVEENFVDTYNERPHPKPASTEVPAGGRAPLLRDPLNSKANKVPS